MQISLPFCRLSFNFGDGFLSKSFSVQCSPTCLFLLLLPLPKEIDSKKNIAKTDPRVLPMFSSRNFMILGLTFKPLIHLEFICVYSVRKLSRFIILYVVVQFSQQHSLKRLSLPHYVFLPPLLQSNWAFKCGFISELFVVLRSVDLCVHFCSSTMIFDCYYSLISNYNLYKRLYKGSMIPPISFFFSPFLLWLLGSLWSQTHFRISCSSSMKNDIGILMGIALNL